MGLFGKKEEKKPRVAEHDGDGSYSQQVVGEKSYRQALLSIIKQHKAFDKGELLLSAYLIPEPENEFDPFAIKVQIEGQKVGFIARSETSEFHEIFKANNLDGLKLKARIGWDIENADPAIGVQLDVSWD